MAWEKWELEYIERNIHRKPEELAERLGKKVTLVINKLANTRHLYEKRCKYEAKVVKKHYKSMSPEEIAAKLGRCKEHVINIMKNMGVWNYKYRREDEDFRSDLIFKGKERFEKMAEVKLGVRCLVKQMNASEQGPNAKSFLDVKGKFVEEHDNFYIFEHERSGCRESFLKADIVTGDKRVNYI